MHVLPKGLMRIRHYGLLANRCRKASLDILRKILVQAAKATEEHPTEEPEAYPLSQVPSGASNSDTSVQPRLAKLLDQARVKNQIELDS